MSTQTLKYVLCHDDAMPPTRAHKYDTGFDVNLVKIVKEYPDVGVTLYSTGVKVQCPPGFYIDLVPRSSMSKTGYMLANSVGIIDQNYTGEILAAIKKINTSDDIENKIHLPCKMVQLVPRQWHYMETEQVVSIEARSAYAPYGATSRGDGGFGSTNGSFVERL